MNARYLGCVLMVASGCAATGAAVTNAVVNTAIASTAAGVSRANGGCYAVCPVGTACNSSTGLCDTLPCRGVCATDEVCVGAGVNEHCERRSELEIQGNGQRPNYLPPPTNMTPPQ